MTSAVSTGDYGGTADADTMCNTLATAAGLGGTWTAWLSTAAQDAAARIDTSGAPYVLVDDTIVAADINALLDGSLDVPIDLDENGAVVVADVWTGTLADGTAAGFDCTGWTTTAGAGRCGATYQNDGRWTDNVTPGCVTGLRLYCVEQS